MSNKPDLTGSKVRLYGEPFECKQVEGDSLPRFEIVATPAP